MVKPTFYFVTTRNCNLKCRHCYLEAGPGKFDTSISPEDFKTVIKNLPKSSFNLNLSGGEVFTIKDKFFSYLESIQEENIEREYNEQGLIDIGVQTNGFWAANDKKMKSLLDDLAYFRVKCLCLASNDKFHREQGIKTENLAALYNQAKNSGLFDSVYLTGAASDAIMPMGRANKVDTGDKYVNYHPWCQNFLKNQNYTLREDGKVYPCCFALHPLSGNIIREPLDAIIEKTKKDERLNILNSKGIKELALYDGWKNKKVEKIINSYGECGLCAKLYDHK